MRAATALERLLNYTHMLQEQKLQIDDRGSASIFHDTLHRSSQLKGHSTAHTDLIELIDPTRTMKCAPTDTEAVKNKMPTPGATAISDTTNIEGQLKDDTVVWDDSVVEFFDLNMFDLESLVLESEMIRA